MKIQEFKHVACNVLTIDVSYDIQRGVTNPKKSRFLIFLYMSEV